ncbi:MEMO1 family protein [Dissulfurispira thermophila]|uniref:MEMO1 family protein JZK55_16450 n=2 Tax=root TaxID=1 RepID=A0A7G1H3M9_9BACT|nr:AmmeMemoRadiSam system protein B [Dissulfurispira thermophila]BCB96723.1 MEMO1 family protein [Dissulfurispira thermophila]
MYRKPAVAGQFYYGIASRLKSQVEEYIIKDAVKEKVIGIISPHAGLMYSGHVAGVVYSSIQFPETFILIGPNHTGLGANVSIMASGQWEIPTGTFSIDEDLSRKILQKSTYLSEDIQAHIFEHSLEVQLPFIAYFSETTKIVPITVMYASLQECKEIGEGIADAIREVDYDVVIAASSDMSHYETDETARRLDNLAIKEVLNLNPEGLYKAVHEHKISMCGFLPVTIMLYAAKALGAKQARLIKYATSGDVSGDYERVVGYAGIVIK